MSTGVHKGKPSLIVDIQNNFCIIKLVVSVPFFLFFIHYLHIRTMRMRSSCFTPRRAVDCENSAENAEANPILSIGGIGGLEHRHCWVLRNEINTRLLATTTTKPCPA